MISPETLRRFPLFAGLDYELLQAMAMFSSEIDLDEGEQLFAERGPASALYLILDGKIDLTITINKSEGKYSCLDRLVEGDFVGWSALIEPYFYTLGAVAAADTSLVQIDSEELRTLLMQHPKAGYHLMLRLVKGVSKRLNDLRVAFVSLTEP